MRNVIAAFVFAIPTLSTAKVDVAPLKRVQGAQPSLMKFAVQAVDLHNDGSVKVLSDRQFKSLNLENSTLRVEGEYIVGIDIKSGAETLVGYISEKDGRASFIVRGDVVEELGGCDCDAPQIKNSKDIVTNPGRSDIFDSESSTVERPSRLEMAGNPGKRTDNQEANSEKPSKHDMTSNPGSHQTGEQKNETGIESKVKDKWKKSANESDSSSEKDNEHKKDQEEKNEKSGEPKAQITEEKKPKVDKNSDEYKKERDIFIRENEKERDKRGKDEYEKTIEKVAGVKLDKADKKEREKQRQEDGRVFDALVDSGVYKIPQKSDSKERKKNNEPDDLIYEMNGMKRNGSNKNKREEKRGDSSSEMRGKNNKVDEKSSRLSGKMTDAQGDESKNARKEFVAEQMRTLGLNDRGNKNEREKYLEKQKQQMGLNKKRDGNEREAYLEKQKNTLGIGDKVADKKDRNDISEERMERNKEKAEQKGLGTSMDISGKQKNSKDEVIRNVVNHDSEKSEKIKKKAIGE